MHMRERFYNELPPMLDAVSFDVTQAAQWFLRDDEKATYDMLEYPALLPPYPEMWLEYANPKYILQDGVPVPTPPRTKMSGCYIVTNELPQDVIDSLPGKENSFLHFALSRYLDGIKMHAANEAPPVVNTNPARWLCVGIVCESTTDLCLMIHIYAMLLDGKGKYIARASVPQPINLVRLVTGRNAQHAELILRASGQVGETCAALVNSESPFHFCLSLLHCRNVQTVDVPPPPAPILKQRAKRGIPYIQYKTLEVSPLRTISQGGTRRDGEQEPKALHFVRGHFKDFTDKGLFGKYKGTYWWSSQVRGDVARGIVDKDYKVSRD
jgi:hypothetical protein